MEDAAAIRQAKQVDAFVLHYCQTHGRLPTKTMLETRFPKTRDPSWIYWIYPNDTTTSLTVQYPANWWHSSAIGGVRISEFTATPYAYRVEYRCPRAGG